MNERRRPFWAFLISIVMLLLANALVPPPGETPSEQETLKLVLVHDLASPAESERPFLPQRVPDSPSQKPANPTVNDAFNRRVEQETMARRAAPASKPVPRPQKRSQERSSLDPLDPVDMGLLGRELALDLDFLSPPTPPVLQGGAVLPSLDVEEGDETWLNSQRIRHGGFFRRLHQSVSRHWDPNTVMRRHDPTGMLYGSEDRITVLHLRLEANGGLAGKPEIISPSGLGMLDREAVRAIVAAAPFPNPPTELIQDGIIDLGRFSFYLQIERGTYGFRPAR